MAKSRPNRRRSQTGWIGLLVVLLALSLAAWLPYRSQQLAVERFQAIGAEVRMEPGPLWVEDLWGDEVFIYDEVESVKMPRNATDEHLRAIEGLASLRTLSVSGSHITDEGLQHLRGLTRLEWLWITNANITGEGLVQLSDSARLQKLYVYNTRFNDDGLRNLTGLKQLAYLNLDRTDISDEGLKHIGKLTSLGTLSFDRTKISDQGLKHLAGLAYFRSVYTDGTQVSEHGIEYLRATFPNIETHRFSVASFLASLEADDWERDASGDSSADPADSRTKSLVQHEFLSGREAAILDVEIRAILSEFWTAVLTGKTQEAMKLIAIPYAGGQLQESVLAHEHGAAEQELMKVVSRVSKAGAVRAVIMEVRRHNDVRELLIGPDRQHFEATMRGQDLVVCLRLEGGDGAPAGGVLTLLSSRNGEPRIVGLLDFEPFK